jgi:hypothetical protein
MIKNYKTTVPAVIALLAVGLHWGGFINQDQLIAGATILSAVGLLGSKDFDKR